MEQVTAKLNDYRQSPRKVRVVADAIRGKRVKDAEVNLKFLTKRASDPIFKLLKSAVANAKNRNIETENLIIKELKVDGGKILYRRGHASRGRSPRIRKRTSHISITLTTNNKQPTTKKTKKLNKKVVVGGKL